MKSKRYISIAILMILFIVLISNISNATDLDSIYVWSNNTQNTITTSAEPENQRMGNFLNLTCGSAILMEQNNNKIRRNNHGKERIVTWLLQYSYIVFLYNYNAYVGDIIRI